MSHRPFTALLSALTFLPNTTYSGITTTPEIIANTVIATPACIRWMPVGECFWLRCTWLGCSVETSTKVAHYNPDLVVSSYNELGGN